MIREFQRNKPHLNIGTIGHQDHGKPSAALLAAAIKTAKEEETKMAKEAVATKKEWRGKCPVCGKFEPLFLVQMDPEEREAIEDGRITPTLGDFMIESHQFGDRVCPGSVSSSPKKVYEVHRGAMGVCCSCQSAHPVQERDGVPGVDFPPADCWVMSPHNFPGTVIQCEGGGTLPQTTFSL